MWTWGRGLSAPDASAPADEPVPGKAGFASAAASGSAWTTLQTVANKFVTVFAMLVLARLLTPAEFGLASLAASIGAFLFVFSPFVMGDVLLAQPKRLNELGATAQSIAWGAGLLLFVILAAAALPIEWISGRAGLAFLLIVVVAQRPLADAAFMLPNARLRSQLAYRRIAMIDAGVILFATVSGVAMAYFGAGASAIIFPPIAMIWLRAFFYARAIRKDSRAASVSVSPSVNHSLARPLAQRFAVAALGQYLHNILLCVDVIVLSFFASETEIGLFGFAAQLAMQANVVIAIQLGGVLQPIFAHIHNDAVRQVSGFIRATRLLSAVAVPLSLIQAALAVPAFTLLFAAKWQGSIAVFATLSVGQAFVFVTAPAIALLKAQGRFKAYFVWQFAQLSAAIVAYACALQFGGPTALRFAAAIGLPVDEDAGKALALSIASALVWVICSPVAVWLAGRPARLSVRSALSIFFAPWLVTVPIALALIGAWAMLRGSIAPLRADIITVTLLGPFAVALSVVGCVCIRADTRADFVSILGRFRPRKMR